jgi:hypothetical protein
MTASERTFGIDANLKVSILGDAKLSEKLVSKAVFYFRT